MLHSAAHWLNIISNFEGETFPNSQMSCEVSNRKFYNFTNSTFIQFNSPAEICSCLSHFNPPSSWRDAASKFAASNEKWFLFSYVVFTFDIIFVTTNVPSPSAAVNLARNINLPRKNSRWEWVAFGNFSKRRQKDWGSEIFAWYEVKISQLYVSLREKWVV